MTAVLPHRTLPPHRLDLQAHERVHGPLPLTGRELVDAVAKADLRGRGGAGFPTARKLAAVRGRRAILVANGCESDPLSQKDRILLDRAPHLVLDGIQLAARAIRATEAVLCLHEATSSVATALAERRDAIPVRISVVPQRYVASEETSLVGFLTTGDARPLGKDPRPRVNGRPTLIQNVDTLAQLAIIARLGPDTYRRTMTRLVTVGGAVPQPGVVEVPDGTTIGSLVPEPVQAVLVGGYGGTWTTSLESPATQGIASVYALPWQSCGVAFTAQVLAYLASESARQCGPCMFGLPAIAADFAGLVRGHPAALSRLAHRLPVIPGRGACAHPDGAVRLATSALQVFHNDITTHVQGKGCVTWQR